MPDRYSALVQVLQSNAGLAGILKGRVFDEELPDSIVSRMPVPCVVVMSSAGARNIGGPDNDFSDAGATVRIYAWRTLNSARALESQVYDVLRHITRKVVGDTLLHWCRPGGSAIAVRAQTVVWPGGVVDQSTHWPYVQRSWQVLAADIPVPTP
jgi:hypothetical protein